MNNLNKIVAVLLLIALIPLPYAYYQLLRIVVTIAAAIYAYRFYENNQTPKAIIFGFIVLIWNPIIPIYLDRSIWMILDVVGAVVFYFGGSDN